MSNLAIIIRPAAIKDLPEVVGMIKELNSHNGFNINSPDEKQLMEHGFGNGSLLHIIIAEITHENGMFEVIGTASYALSYKISIGKVAILSGMFVKPNYRSHGVGKQLYQQAVKEVLEDHNCHQMVFNVSDDKEASKTFYKKLGAIDSYKEIHLAPFIHFRGKPLEKSLNTASKNN